MIQLSPYNIKKAQLIAQIPWILAYKGDTSRFSI